MNNLMKCTRLQLWIKMCKMGIIHGDCSLYNMRGWSKQDMIEAINQHNNELPDRYWEPSAEDMPNVLPESEWLPDELELPFM